MSDSIRDNLDGEALGIANRFFARLAVAHDAWKFQCFGNRRKLRGLTTRAQDAILPYNQTDPLPKCDKIDCAEEITGCNSCPVCLLSISWKIPHPYRRKAHAPARV